MDLSLQESEFVRLVQDDLERYRQMGDHRSVLVFPTLPSRLRFLIHRTVDDLPELTTFSVGESWCRQVVVCHAGLRCDVDANKQDVNTKPQSSARKRNPKRPDKALYVPKVLRERLRLENSQGPAEDREQLSSSSPSADLSGERQSPGQFPKSHAGVTEEENLPPGAIQNTEGHLVLNSEESASASAVEEDPTSCLAGLTLEENRGSESSADLAEDKDTDDIIEEIKQHLKDFTSVSIQHVHNDYFYEDVRANLEGFGHVIEIYDFPNIFKTEDLLEAFVDYSDGGMKIKWVDDTHALGVFSSEAAALEALSIHHPLLKTRPLARGSKKAKGKAIRQAEFIQPVRERPKTDSAVAKRLVSRALGQQRREVPPF
ncbi:R3H and coiled-coil domain-containing protein 1 isoform X2 [Synchiropus splendidus]|uniref:R3H and coiled-coil domain-containing protein 1 isoform X2 n=1 Tax=Synchiropus splendidus TaxID=270530 RepID=UPI00237ED1A5|nr:R3H and coiled-coil domain-containing protein 1 isoform X2 [Synchiropus splendidus]